MVAELATSKLSQPAGVLCHGALLLLLLNHYVACLSLGRMIDDRKGAHHRSSSLLVLTLIPILRITSVTMPNGEMSPIFWYALMSLPLALGVVLIARLLGAGRADLALRWTATQPFIALIGVPLGAVAIELPQAGPVIE
ncbi:MAG: hypothetical protein LC799_08130, partial [Actinobacteria bacterium]|nr:hypothetical protein [Actinomycetota bacterium]